MWLLWKRGLSWLALRRSGSSLSGRIGCGAGLLPLQTLPQVISSRTRDIGTRGDVRHLVRPYQFKLFLLNHIEDPLFFGF